MRYAIVKDGLVDNIIVAEQDFVNNNYPDAILLSDDDFVNLGYTYSEGKFIKPEPRVVEEVTESPTSEPTE